MMSLLNIHYSEREGTFWMKSSAAVCQLKASRGGHSVVSHAGFGVLRGLALTGCVTAGVGVRQTAV